MKKPYLVVWLMASTSLVQARAQSTAPPPPPQAVRTHASPGRVEEIVVTAQKRSERINNVPLAITAVTGAVLTQQGVRDTSDLARVVPSFNVQTSLYNSPVYFIRGVGFSDLSANSNPTVSVYDDEVPIPYSAMTRGAVLDLARVEVLKGPQGTLFGENSTGGAVNFISAKPTPTLHYGADVSYGRFNDVIANGYVSGPISDTLGVRIALQGEHQDDWQYSQTRNDSRGQRSFVNGRVILAWKPTASAHFDLIAQAWQDKSDTQTPQFVRFTPLSPGENPQTTAGLEAAPPAPDNDRATDWDAGSPKARNNLFFQIALRSVVDLAENLHVTSITAYSGLNLFQPVDTDGTAYPDLFLRDDTRIRHVSQELRVDGSSGKLRWMVGANYEHDKNSDYSHFALNTTDNSVFGLSYHDITQIDNNPNINTYAGFGSLEYALTDTLTARGSVRYTSVNDEHQGCLADGGQGDLSAAFSVLSSVLSGSQTTILPGQCATLSSTTFKPVGLVTRALDQDNTSWRVGLDWKVRPNTLLYGNVAKGYKAGGFESVPAVFPEQLAPVTQESVLAYEGGLKAGFLNNRAHLDLSGFYYDYNNKQLQGYVVVPPFGPLPTLVNVPKSHVYGVEAELEAVLTPLLRAKLSGTYLFTEVTSNPSAPLSPLGEPTSFIGESFPNAPRYQFRVDLEQRIPVSDTIEGYIGGDVAYHSDAAAAFGRNASALDYQLFKLPSYTLVDLRAGVRLNDGHDGLELWGRNVTNAFYLNSVTNGDTNVRFTGMPATYGIRLFHNF